MRLHGFLVPCAVLALSLSSAASRAVVNPPQLKWAYGGCFSSWCETGWYSSPAAMDVDGDGTIEIIASAYSIVVLGGGDGSLRWRMPSGHDRSQPDADNVGRTWPSIILRDVDGDGQTEIITAHSGGYVSVYDHNGFFKPGWPRQPTSRELRGLVVDDLDGDGDMEIVVSAAISSKTNTWVFEHNGVLRPGWPRLSDETGYAWGVFNDNAWIADLDGNGSKEIVVPSDVHYICAYDGAGNQLAANARYGGSLWGQVGLWESPATEERGWGDCSTSREERYRANFAHGPATVADLDGDGRVEIAATGNMRDCAAGHPSGKYTALFLLNADRGRYQGALGDWSVPPVDIGAPLSEDFNVIENCQPNPVAADLDGDGKKEVLFAAYDGRVHAFWLDKTEHGSWPWQVYNPAEGFFRFASEPVVADLDRDGHAEVIVVSWPAKQDGGAPRLGRVHILDYLGNLVAQVDLPAPRSSSRSWNGALAAPLLANIDADPDLELVVNTVFSGVVAYDLPGSAGARILWQSGRNRNGGNGTVAVPPLVFPLLK